MRELHIDCVDEDNYSMGQIYDMLIEKMNDQEKYEIKATQEDFDKF